MDNGPVWLNVAKSIINLFMNKKAQVEVTIPINGPKEEPVPQSTPNMEFMPNIDWSNPESKISNHFTVKEACYLPSWKVMHNPSEAEKQNILKQAAKMDLIRDFLGAPINVHCWIRPVLNCPGSEYHGRDYNAFVHGAKNSAHKIGLATDYDAQGMNCDNVRSELEPKLEQWQIRMERMPGGKWIHNDCAPVICHAYFNP